eukprot:CAMPEP_0176448248 /NCGR_PEP_ID=MMETSP0127-20121128/25643_1 /TAXON_ID=938130 /ORGANISM="Platyophrya macrostoma, Strain WH" /LENGTH=144 /DNA_ID=CAMNT_0017835107 /DNA_START=76 /DNA_END=510 /DNA_ORIENTATION=-
MNYKQRYNTPCADKLYNTPMNNKKYNNKQNVKTSYNSYDKRFNLYEPNFDFASPKKALQFEGGFKGKLNKANNSGYSTMASEGDQEPEVMGFKVVQSGKILFDVQSSDSDSSYSPCERKEESCYASATNYLGPAPQKISLPSFL